MYKKESQQESKINLRACSFSRFFGFHSSDEHKAKKAKHVLRAGESFMHLLPNDTCFEINRFLGSDSLSALFYVNHQWRAAVLRIVHFDLSKNNVAIDKLLSIDLEPWLAQLEEVLSDYRFHSTLASRRYYKMDQLNSNVAEVKALERPLAKFIHSANFLQAMRIQIEGEYKPISISAVNLLMDNSRLLNLVKSAQVRLFAEDFYEAFEKIKLYAQLVPTHPIAAELRLALVEVAGLHQDQKFVNDLPTISLS